MSGKESNEGATEGENLYIVSGTQVAHIYYIPKTSTTGMSDW